jgi:hypothetical protein
MRTTISSIQHLISYLSTQGANVERISENTLRVTDGLLLVVENGYVIPTGNDDGYKWLSEFTNSISNLLISYVV